MIGGKYMAIGIIVLIILSAFKKYATIIILVLLALWIIRLCADLYWKFKDKDDYW